MVQALKKQANIIGHGVLDFLLPPLCPATGEPVDAHGMVHAQYWQSLTFINPPYCASCGNPFSFTVENMVCGSCLERAPIYHSHRSALTYDEASRKLILRFKHGDQIHAARAFIPWLVQAGQTMLHETDILIPVPLHTLRLIKRRFNQADIIARQLLPYVRQVDYLADGLVRTRHTQSQGHKKAKDRKRNVRKAFEVKYPHKIENKKILLIDDVYTTGATLNECAKTLYDSGAAQVDCLTLAKVVK
jgi:ComF family protein